MSRKRRVRDRGTGMRLMERSKQWIRFSQGEAYWNERSLRRYNEDDAGSQSSQSDERWNVSAAKRLNRWGYIDMVWRLGDCEDFSKGDCILCVQLFSASEDSVRSEWYDSSKWQTPGVLMTWENFSRRIVNIWNSLPSEVVNAPSLNSFKTDLTDSGWTKISKLWSSSTNKNW